MSALMVLRVVEVAPTVDFCMYNHFHDMAILVGVTAGWGAALAADTSFAASRLSSRLEKKGMRVLDESM